MSSPSTRRSNGFTIVELLVVIAIIGVLISLLFPALNAARAAARRSTCQSHLHQLGVAVMAYGESRNLQLPPLWLSAQPRPWDNFSWRVELLPYLEMGNATELLKRNEMPLSEANRPVSRLSIPVFECPATPQSPRKIVQLGFAESTYSDCLAGASDYSAVYEVKMLDRSFPAPGAWYGGQDLEMQESSMASPMDRDTRSQGRRTVATSLSAVRDGLGQTGLMVEQAGKPDRYGKEVLPDTQEPAEGAWITAEYSTFQGEGVNVDNYGDPFGFHGAAMALMCDASVRSWAAEMDAQVLRALLSRDSREIISDADWR